MENPSNVFSLVQPGATCDRGLVKTLLTVGLRMTVQSLSVELSNLILACGRPHGAEAGVEADLVPRKCVVKRAFCHVEFQ